MLSVTRWVGSPASLALHTVVFVSSFVAVWAGFVDVDRMLLVLTTLVSLEAIYLAIFIQMSVNAQSEAISEVEQDIDEIQEDIDEIQEDVEEIHEEEIKDDMRDDADHQTLEELRQGLAKLMDSVNKLQQK